MTARSSRRRGAGAGETAAACLRAIVNADDAITSLILGYCREAFLGDEKVRGAVLRRLLDVGDAAAGLPEAYRDEHPEIPWRDLADCAALGAREGIPIDWTLVWTAAAVRLPRVSEALASLLFAEGAPSA